MELLIATANPHKAREFREMLSDGGLRDGDAQIVWSDLFSVPNPPHVEETGTTFRANACIKASAYAKHYQRWTMADDSGLEVDALNGAPGVVSARFAELHNAGKGDAANNALLLKLLANVPDEKRTARFVCVLAIADPQGHIILTARESVEGRIVHQSRGENGFGYDPLFLIDELGQTTAELRPDQKHTISHRGRALRALKEMLDQHGRAFAM